MKRLSTKQLQIMNILWDSDKPLIASQILNLDNSLNINTIQCVLKGLLKKNYIELADIVYSGTVLARSYRFIIPKSDYYQNLFDELKNPSDSSIVLVTLAQQEKNIEVLDELEKIIKKTKERLKNQ